MKHKWEPIDYYRGPHKWPGAQECSVCHETFHAQCDPLDSERAQKVIDENYARDDCMGEKQ